MSLPAMVFEGAVAAVLVVAALLCWRVDRRLAALRSGQDGVLAAVAALNEATGRAEAAIAALRAASADAGLEAMVTDARRPANTSAPRDLTVLAPEPVAAPIAQPVSPPSLPHSPPVKPSVAGADTGADTGALAEARALLARARVQARVAS